MLSELDSRSQGVIPTTGQVWQLRAQFLLKAISAHTTARNGWMDGWIYLLDHRNLLWDILRLPSSCRAALGLYVISHYDEDEARTSHHIHCCIGARRATHCATGDDIPGGTKNCRLVIGISYSNTTDFPFIRDKTMQE